jgi:site-specific recombinase XerD
MWVEQLPSGRYRAGYRLDGGRKIHRTFDYRYEAEAWAIMAEGRAEQGLADDPPADLGSVTLGDYGTAYLQRRAGELAAATRANYQTHLRGIVRTGLAQEPMDQLTRSQVQAWITRQREAGAGASSINSRLKLVRQLYGDALAELLVPHDPTKGIRLLAENTSPDRVLTRDEEARLLQVAADDPVLTAQLLLALDAGLRWSELAAMSLDGVLLEQRLLSVHQVVERATASIRSYTKGRKPRLVPVTDRLAEALVPITVEAMQDRDGLLWRAQRGGVLSYWDHAQQLKRASRTARVRPAPGWHALRHTYGSRLGAAGVPRNEIAKLMGHVDEATTGRYIHAGDEARRAALVRQALELA